MRAAIASITNRHLSQCRENRRVYIRLLQCQNGDQFENPYTK